MMFQLEQMQILVVLRGRGIAPVPQQSRPVNCCTGRLPYKNDAVNAEVHTVLLGNEVQMDISIWP